MTHFKSYAAIQGQKPWGQRHESVEEGPREPAPRQEATYHCAGVAIPGEDTRRPCAHPGGTFTVPFAAGVEPQAAWDCRCGGTGRLDGAPEDAEVILPGYGQQAGGWPKGTRPKDGMDPMGQLLKRREIPELEEQLAERLAQMRQQRAGAQ